MEPPLDRALDELDSAIVPDLQMLGDDANRRSLRRLQRLQHQEQLMLLRLDVGGAPLLPR
jgi:hypothetical protein